MRKAGASLKYKKESYGEEIKVFSVKDNTQSNPSLTGKVSFAMKSCFAGVRSYVFDFYRRLVLWISSERSEDYIVAVWRFH